MKRLLALTLILILVFSISPVSQAFQDATANPYTGLIYTHDDKFDDSSLSYGVDLSVYQGSVNFSKLKNDGISFAILRAAYRGYKDSGPLAKDTKFASYASAAIDAGLDIGGTFIGMHLKKVAVPVRLSVDHLGEAIILCARVRPKFIGGVRAVYDENLL